MEYERRYKEKFPVLAICYDFDKTLSPDDMQAQGYIQSVGYNINEFWKKSNDLAADNDMDTNLAYMYTMKEEAEGNFVFTKKKLAEYGAKVKLFNGVEEWFERIRAYGKAHGVIVEHYIISSGLKEMIEGTSIAKNGAFEKIYASSFYYNERGVAVWPAQVINYTSKTQFLFRIEKGTLDINDSAVNEYFPPDQMRVPFRNIVYIGDSDTDIPCMKLVNVNGGHSIGVYNSATKDKSKVFRMLEENRIKYFVPADYTEDSKLEILVKKIIDRTISNEKLESVYFECLAEEKKERKNQSEEELQKEDLINKLEDSGSFANTHTIIGQLTKITEWSEKQKEKLLRIALGNSQVKSILQDIDVRDFYGKICAEMRNTDADEVRKLLNGEKK